MVDELIDIFDDREESDHQRLPMENSRYDDPMIDLDGLITIAEFASMTHHSASPLQLMKTLAYLDNYFLSDKRSVSIEEYYLDHLVSIFG